MPRRNCRRAPPSAEIPAFVARPGVLVTWHHIPAATLGCPRVFLGRRRCERRLVFRESKETFMSLSDELSKLGELRASGALTEEEFTRAKERLLNASGAARGARPEEPAHAAGNACRPAR